MPGVIYHTLVVVHEPVVQVVPDADALLKVVFVDVGTHFLLCFVYVEEVDGAFDYKQRFLLQRHLSRRELALEDVYVVGAQLLKASVFEVRGYVLPAYPVVDSVFLDEVDESSGLFYRPMLICVFNQIEMGTSEYLRIEVNVKQFTPIC